MEWVDSQTPHPYSEASVAVTTGDQGFRRLFPSRGKSPAMILASKAAEAQSRRGESYDFAMKV